MLSGRCYERESVPYKALDSADRRARALPRRASTAREVAALLPRDVAVARARLPGAAPRGGDRTGAPSAPARCPTRRRCGAARSRRCASCSRASPTAGRSSSHVDDAAVGRRRQRRASSPTCCARPTRRRCCCCSRTARRTARRAPSCAGSRRRAAGRRRRRTGARSRSARWRPTTRGASRARCSTADPGPAEAIAAESRGNPYFVGELAQHVRAGGALGASGAVTLEGVLLARAERLAERAKPPARGRRRRRRPRARGPGVRPRRRRARRGGRPRADAARRPLDPHARARPRAARRHVPRPHPRDGGRAPPRRDVAGAPPAPRRGPGGLGARRPGARRDPLPAGGRAAPRRRVVRAGGGTRVGRAGVRPRRAPLPPRARARAAGGRREARDAAPARGRADQRAPRRRGRGRPTSPRRRERPRPTRSSSAAARRTSCS